MAALSPCSQRDGGPEAGSSFPAEELNPAAGPAKARSKGPWLLPWVERKNVSRRQKAAEIDTKFIIRDTAGLMGEHTEKQSRSEYGRNTRLEKTAGLLNEECGTPEV